VIILSEKGWFEEGHDLKGWIVDPEGFLRPVISSEGKTFICWAPAPMAADVALAEMLYQTATISTCVCLPSLVHRSMVEASLQTADLVFELPVGTNMWSKSMHKPLLIGILFPFIRSKPWQLRGTRRYTQCWEGNCAKCSKKRQWMQAIFCANFGYAVSTSQICQNLWCGSCYTSSSTPDFFMAAGGQLIAEADDEDRILSGWTPRRSDVGRFTSARNGDNLMVPFECDFCVFGKLFDRAIDMANDNDGFAMGCIRRVILDAFWS
jgi:hypothetical protein